jgi:dTDP-4-amino-4,6-dideoxygalactose transaminase
MINVTEPFLPPKEKYLSLLDEVWKRNWLTNNGPLVNELELKLKEFLEIDHLLYLTNGTIAIQLAIKALELKGEVITTPFSYVATTSSIVWENCTPKFVDIHPESFNIDPSKIEDAIGPNTTAILATHVYGNPCDVIAIDKIARKHNLKVIYDAAHAIGVKVEGKSILKWGDISTLSFHATKPFHTIEGGAVATNSAELLKKMSWLRNFGHDGPFKFASVGINGKNSEFHAAMGLCNLEYIDSILLKRKEDSEYYDKLLLNKLPLKRPLIHPQANYNHAYYPLVFSSEAHLLAAMNELELNRIYSRRYFYPDLTDLPYVEKSDVPIAKRIAKQVLCLPLYYTLSKTEIDMICRFILRSQRYMV